MTFISIQFVIFFAIVTTLYFAIPHKWRWLLLLMAGVIFYMSFIPVYILFLLLLIIIDYFAGIFIAKSKGPKRKIFLFASIISTVTALFVFKYHDFFVTNFDTVIRFWDWNYSPKLLKLVLPVGLSFHTFQSLAYVIEVFRGRQKVERNFGIYALYVMFYPQLMAGPIERPGHMLHQFYEKHYFDYTRVVRGLRLMLWGAFEKVVIADQAAKVVNLVYADPQSFSGTSLLIATVLFAFQIFCDFDGYSNIARGAARVMGFELMVNFNRPYLARGFRDFWQRWHISLSTWFRDFFYIPLGGSRVPKLRRIFNIMATFLVSGLWHGANWTFVVWGGLHGLYLLFFKNLKSRLITFVLATVAWVFFRASSLKDAFYIIGHLFSGGTPAVIGTKILGLSPTVWVVLVAAISVMMFIHVLQDKVNIQNQLERRHGVIRWALYYALVLIILILAAQGREQFIYFQF